MQRAGGVADTLLKVLRLNDRFILAGESLWLGRTSVLTRLHLDGAVDQREMKRFEEHYG
jgi:hypothetical protein